MTITEDRRAVLELLRAECAVRHEKLSQFNAAWMLMYRRDYYDDSMGCVVNIDFKIRDGDDVRIATVDEVLADQAQHIYFSDLNDENTPTTDSTSPAVIPVESPTTDSSSSTVIPVESPTTDDQEQDVLEFDKSQLHLGMEKTSGTKVVFIEVGRFRTEKRDGTLDPKIREVLIDLARSYRKEGYKVYWLGMSEADRPFRFGIDVAREGRVARERRQYLIDQDDADHGQFPANSYCSITNAEVTHDGEQEIVEPYKLSELRNRIREQLFDWPRRIGKQLFVPDTGRRVHYLSTPDELVSWFSRFGHVEWRNDSKRGCVSQAHLFHELVRSAPSYDAVEHLPHEPKMSGTYYSYRDVVSGDGTALDELLDAFAPETESDRELIRSLFVTTFWGGEPGTRPAFLITADSGRGAGKSKLAQLVGQLVGGMLDFSSNEEIEVIKQRLLTPDAASNRVAVLDNIKSLRFSWADWEALVTADVVSGKRLYYGDASRRNTLTWILTLNGASLSTDVAQRVVEIKLARPLRDGLWEERVRRLVRERRDDIIADIVAVLRRPATQLARHTRWATWESEVLARMGTPNELLRVIEERRGAADVEADEAGLIDEYFAEQLANCHYDIQRDRVHLPVKIVAEWTRRALGESMTTAAASRRLTQLIAEGRLGRTIGRNPSRTHSRGFVWEGESAEPQSSISYDLTTRIEFRRTGSPDA